MSWFSKLVPNEIKPVIQPLATAAGYYFGGPIGAAAGNAIGAKARGASTSDTIKGAALTYAGSSLFDAAGGTSLFSGGDGTSTNGLWENAKEGTRSLNGGGIWEGLKGSANEAYNNPGYDPLGDQTGSLYNSASTGPTTGGGDIGKFGDLSPSRLGTGREEGILDILRRNAQRLSPLVTGVNLASGAFGLYNAAQARKLGAPGRAASAEMTRLTNDPNAIRALPGYQGGMDAGTQQLNRTLAAQGQTGGGLAAEANARFAGTYDSTFRNAELTRLQNVAQGGIAADVHANEIVRRALEQISYSFRRA